MSAETKATLLIQVVQFPEEVEYVPLGYIPIDVASGKFWQPISKTMACLIGPGSHGIYWLREDGDWERGSAIALDMNSIVEQKEF